MPQCSRNRFWSGFFTTKPQNSGMGLPGSPVNHLIARRPIVGHWYSWEWCNFSVQFTHACPIGGVAQPENFEDYRKNLNDINMHEWSF